jgi:hypothetical protein
VTLTGFGYPVGGYCNIREDDAYGAYGDVGNDGILLHSKDIHIPSYRDDTPCHSGLLNLDTCFHLLFERRMCSHLHAMPPFWGKSLSLLKLGYNPLQKVDFLTRKSAFFHGL